MSKIIPLDLTGKYEIKINLLKSDLNKSITLQNIVSATKVTTYIVVRRLSKSKIFNNEQLAEAIEYYNSL